MSDVYKIQYNGMTLAYPGWNGAVSYEAATAFKTLTLCASNGGTLTAETITGLPGDTITLSPTYDTYWRFSGYDVYGDGAITDNTYTFGNDDEQIVSAYFKPNAFTATGNFEKGSNVSVTGTSTTRWNTQSIGAKYALHQNHTGDIPSSWYNTSNRWKVNDASAYSITFNIKLTYTANYAAAITIINTATAYGLIGSTSTGSVTTNFPSNTWNYNKTFTTTTQDVNYGLNGTVGAKRYGNSKGITTYVANNTNGTWTATGIAP